MREEAVPLRLVLLVTAFEGAENFGAAVSKGAEVVLEVVRSRRAALALLRRGQYAAIVVDAALSKTEVTQTEALWQNSSGAVPLDVDLRVLRAEGLTRLLRNVLEGREQMEAKMRENIRLTMSEELRSTVTGLLLQSDLALRDKALTPAVEHRVRELRALADGLRLRYRQAI